MKVIIAGGRDYDEFKVLYTAMNKFLILHPITEVVYGGAQGADAFGACWAADQHIPVKLFPADWKTLGKAAGPIRNHDMAKYADWLVAFWDGRSRGTKNMIDNAFKEKIGITIYSYE